jgi:hypothetical protein
LRWAFERTTVKRSCAEASQNMTHTQLLMWNLLKTTWAC